jgi:hypothetical protein
VDLFRKGGRRIGILLTVGASSGPCAAILAILVWSHLWRSTDPKSIAHGFGLAFEVGSVVLVTVVCGYCWGGLRGYIHGRIDTLRDIHETSADVNEQEKPFSSEVAQPLLGERVQSREYPKGSRMELANMVMNRFWHPDRFDPADPDTAPKQSAIIEFIREQRPGISDANAKAIEKVACPIDR